MSSAILHRIVEAHGGLKNWQSVESIQATINGGGLLMGLKRKNAQHQSLRGHVSTREHRVVVQDFPNPGERGYFTASEVYIEGVDGTVQESRNHPLELLSTQQRRLTWDDLDFLSFVGYMFWDFLLTPFSLLSREFELSDLGPWSDNGHTWNMVKVEFPPGFPTPSPQQVFYVDDSGFLQRIDYLTRGAHTITGGTQYLLDHKRFSGIVYPTTRVVYPKLGMLKSFKLVKAMELHLDDVKLVRKQSAIRPI